MNRPEPTSVSLGSQARTPDVLIPLHSATESTPTIYASLEEHQREEKWDFQNLMTELQGYKDLFVAEFKLELTEVALCVDRLPANRYGHFRHGWNGFGLRCEIALNTLYMDGSRPKWKWLGTLFHELLHAWQEIHGNPGKGNFHNQEFREKAAACGLIIDEKGRTHYHPGSPFMGLLERLGFEIQTEDLIAADDRRKGSSKLRKWSCSCPVNLRVGVKDFRAVCLTCQQPFLPQS